MAHFLSSDWQISKGDSGARNREPLEGLSHEQHGNEFKSAQDDVNGGHGKREREIEREKYNEVLQLSSGPSQDAAERSENSKSSKDSNAGLTASRARLCHSRRMVMSNRAIDRKCTLRKPGRKEIQFLTW